MTTIPPRNGCNFRIFIILLLVIVIFAAISVFFFVGAGVKQAIEIASSMGGPSVNIGAVPGDPSHFDPIASYETIHDFAGETLDLDSIVISYVRSDGTLDLKAGYDPTVNYRFFHELSTPPPSAPPLGSKGVTDQKWDDQVEVLVQPTRIISIGGNVQGLTAISAPKCTMKRLWSAALEKGAPPDAVASVVINKSGYNFSIRNTKISLHFDTDCRLS
jgi:hypothetical protein